MAQSTKCLILLAVIALFFVTEIIPLAVTAMAGAIACGLLGFIPAKQVFSGLSNSTVVLFAGMFVVGAAMFYTGLAQRIGETVVRFTGTGENSLMIGIMLVGAALSSVLSNTGTAACLLPVVLGVCAAATACSIGRVRSSKDPCFYRTDASGIRLRRWRYHHSGRYAS